MATRQATARTLPTAPAVTGASAAEAMPPFIIPESHFIVALLWLGAGSLGFVAVARDLAGGIWLSPPIAAVAHAITLGWVVTSAYGALYQLAPVALGVPFTSRVLAHATLVLHTIGTALIVAGLTGWWPGLIGLGWSWIAIGLLAWTWNLGTRLMGAPRARRSGVLAAVSFLFLWLAIGLGGVRIGHAMGWWLVPREAIVGAHAQLAAVGFGTLLVMGIGSHILPMFLQSRGAPDWPVRIGAPLTAGGILLQAAGWLAGMSELATGGSLVAAAGVVLFLYQVWLWTRHRARIELDVGLRQVVGAVVLLMAAIGMGLAALFTHEPRFIAAYGVLLLVGWLAMVVGGVYARILPFLTWLDRHGGRADKRGVPKMTEMLPQRWASLVSAAWLSGVVVATAGIVMGMGRVAQAGAAVFAAGTAGAVVLYASLLRRR